MSNPLPYLVRMLLFLVAVAGLAYVLWDDLLRVFLNTPILDGVIVGVLVVGILVVMRQVISLWPEVRWLRRFQHREPGAAPLETDSINLLVPMAAMLGEKQDNVRLSPVATRALLDGIATRLDERRELTRYLIGLLIFLGLLGTFWGLLQTIGAVADAIVGLQATAGDAVQMFAKLKGSIEGPLKGMSTAFGASLFGLSGSLVLGFLELQASQAQGRFHIELEEMLARATSISGGGLLANEGPGVPAYVEALLERSTEGLDGLTRTLQRIEESRQATTVNNVALVERLAALAEAMRVQQTLLARFTEQSIELRGAIGRLSDRSGADADRESLRVHQRSIEAQVGRLAEESGRNRIELAVELRSAADADREALLTRQGEIDVHLNRLIEEIERNRAEVIKELRGVANRLANPSTSDADREALLPHQRRLETQLGDLVEGSKRNHTELTEELRGVANRLADRSAADSDREALLAHQRDIEAHLVRLVEESARNRTAIADELRSAVDRLAERFGGGDREALMAHQRNIEAHLARLVEESALNRTALADELRGELRLLARTIALIRDTNQSPAEG